MTRDEDRERRRSADREAQRLLFAHREHHQPPAGAADRSWAALQRRIAAGEAAPVEPPARTGGGAGRRAVIVALAAAAGLALWQWGPRAARRGAEEGALAAIFTRIDPDGSRRAAWAGPKDSKGGAGRTTEERSGTGTGGASAAGVGTGAGVGAESGAGGVAGPGDRSAGSGDRSGSAGPGDRSAGPGDRSAGPGDRSVGGDLAVELAQVRAAGEAVRAGKGEEGLAAAEAYLLAHPLGAFAPEARLHRAEALCLLGRVAEARAVAAAFVRELPDSPLRARVVGVCAGEK